jgi:hypothetical protein
MTRIGGGGIANSGTVTLINSTVATNICVGSGGGIANLAGSTTLQNTILARNGSFFFWDRRIAAGSSRPSGPT